MPSPESPKDSNPSLEDDIRETEDDHTANKEKGKSKPTSAGDGSTLKPPHSPEQPGRNSPETQPSASTTSSDVLPSGEDNTTRDSEQSKVSSATASLQGTDGDSSSPSRFLISDSEHEETQQPADHPELGATGTQGDTEATSNEKEPLEEQQENAKSDNSLKRSSFGESEGSPSKKNKIGMLERILREGGTSVGYTAGGTLVSTGGPDVFPLGGSSGAHVPSGAQLSTNMEVPPSEHSEDLLGAKSKSTSGTPVDELARLAVSESSDASDTSDASAGTSSLAKPEQVDEKPKNKNTGAMVQNLFLRLARRTKGSLSFTGFSSGTGTATDTFGETGGTGVKLTGIHAEPSYSSAGLRPGSGIGTSSGAMDLSQSSHSPMMSQLLSDDSENMPTKSSDTRKPQPGTSGEDGKNKADRSKSSQEDESTTKHRKNSGGSADAPCKKDNNDDDDIPPPAPQLQS